MIRGHTCAGLEAFDANARFSSYSGHIGEQGEICGEETNWYVITFCPFCAEKLPPHVPTCNLCDETPASLRRGGWLCLDCEENFT